MSVSIHYQAVIPVDGTEYANHRAVVEACQRAGVATPQETVAFFDDSDEEREVTIRGIFVLLDYGEYSDAVDGDVMNDGEAFIDVRRLPPGATHIRVKASC